MVWWQLPGGEPLPEGLSALSLVGSTASDWLAVLMLGIGSLGAALLVQERWAGSRSSEVYTAGPKHFPSASHL
jgi:hypothetical protein